MEAPGQNVWHAAAYREALRTKVQQVERVAPCSPAASAFIIIRASSTCVKAVQQDTQTTRPAARVAVGVGAFTDKH